MTPVEEIRYQMPDWRYQPGRDEVGALLAEVERLRAALEGIQAVFTGGCGVDGKVGLDSQFPTIAAYCREALAGPLPEPQEPA